MFLVWATILATTQVQATVDRARLQNADSEPGSWLNHGRNYAEDRESPLVDITPEKFAWFMTPAI